MPAIKDNVLIRPDQATSLPNKRNVLDLLSLSKRIPVQTGNKGNIHGEKNDNTPAKKTDTKNKILSN